MSRRLQVLQDFLATQSLQIPLWGFMLNLMLAGIFSYLLSRLYIKYGASLSNRAQFARNFVLLAMTTTLVIAIIKSSLALSLGLVGALSIVRFRAAIKEPEELTYLFLNIAIGLGFGAEQRLITIAAFAFIAFAVWFKNQKNIYKENQNLFLTLSSTRNANANLENFVSILREKCGAVSLKRFDETQGNLEASFLIEFSHYDDLKECKDRLRALDQDIQITLLDNKGMLQ